MPELAGLFFASALLLAVAGVAKLVRPAPTADALRRAGLPAAVWLVRAIGVAEVGIALAAVARGGPVAAALVAAAYLSFVAFVVALLRQGGAAAGCGCFGRADPPVGWQHLVIDSGLAAVALLAVLDPVPSYRVLAAAQPWSGLPLTLWILAVAYVLYLTLVALPGALGRPLRVR